MQEREQYVLPVDSLVQDLPVLELDLPQVIRIAQGQRLEVDTALQDGKVRVYGEGRFVGVAELLAQRLTPIRLLSWVAKRAACRDR